MLHGGPLSGISPAAVRNQPRTAVRNQPRTAVRNQPNWALVFFGLPAGWDHPLWLRQLAKAAASVCWSEARDCASVMYLGLITA